MVNLSVKSQKTGCKHRRSHEVDQVQNEARSDIACYWVELPPLDSLITPGTRPGTSEHETTEELPFISHPSQFLPIAIDKTFTPMRLLNIETRMPCFGVIAHTIVQHILWE